MRELPPTTLNSLTTKSHRAKNQELAIAQYTDVKVIAQTYQLISLWIRKREQIAIAW
jgi:hypothetical protein